jgi:hypothetical protein
MSFGNFNPDTEALQAAAKRRAVAGRDGKEVASDDKSSSDEEDVAVSKHDMARGWGKANSLRMNGGKRSKKARHM